MTLVALLVGACGSIEPLAEVVVPTVEPDPVLVVLATEAMGDVEGLAEEFSAATGVPTRVLSVADGAAILGRMKRQSVGRWVDVVVGLDEWELDEVEPLMAERIAFGRPVFGDPVLDGLGGEWAWPAAHDEVCVVFDPTWFEARDEQAPSQLGDLTDPRQSGRALVSRPSRSEEGLTFAIHTAEVFGDPGWKSWWSDLVDNEAEVVGDGVTAAPGGARPWFSGVDSDADGRPIAVSGLSGLTEARSGSVAVLPGSCRRQVKFMGVSADASMPDEAGEFVEYLSNPDRSAVLAGESWPTRGPIGDNGGTFPGPVETGRGVSAPAGEALAPGNGTTTSEAAQGSEGTESVGAGPDGPDPDATGPDPSPDSDEIECDATAGSSPDGDAGGLPEGETPVSGSPGDTSVAGDEGESVRASECDDDAVAVASEQVRRWTPAEVGERRGELVADWERLMVSDRAP